MGKVCLTERIFCLLAWAFALVGGGRWEWVSNSTSIFNLYWGVICKAEAEHTFKKQVVCITSIIPLNKSPQIQRRLCMALKRQVTLLNYPIKTKNDKANKLKNPWIKRIFSEKSPIFFKKSSIIIFHKINLVYLGRTLLQIPKVNY